MANSRELLINAVISSKPKALTGLNQKVNGQVQGVSFPLPSLSSHRRRGRAYKPSVVHPWNVVSPSSSLLGRFAARRGRWGGG